MTPDNKKLWRKVILRSIGAVAFGWTTVMAFVVLLSFYGASPDIHLMTAAKMPKFPENEQMLNAITSQLARDGAALSKIEPAAGMSKQKKNVVIPVKTGTSGR